MWWESCHRAYLVPLRAANDRHFLNIFLTQVFFPHKSITWSSRVLGIWQQRKSVATWPALPPIRAASTAAKASRTPARHYSKKTTVNSTRGRQEVNACNMMHRQTAAYLYWATDCFVREAHANGLKERKSQIWHLLLCCCQIVRSASIFPLFCAILYKAITVFFTSKCPQEFK